MKHSKLDATVASWKNNANVLNNYEYSLDSHQKSESQLHEQWHHSL